MASVASVAIDLPIFGLSISSQVLSNTSNSRPSAICSFLSCIFIVPSAPYCCLLMKFQLWFVLTISINSSQSGYRVYARFRSFVSCIRTGGINERWGACSEYRQNHITRRKAACAHYVSYVSNNTINVAL